MADLPWVDKFPHQGILWDLTTWSGFPAAWQISQNLSDWPDLSEDCWLPLPLPRDLETNLWVNPRPLFLPFWLNLAILTLGSVSSLVSTSTRSVSIIFTKSGWRSAQLGLSSVNRWEWRSLMCLGRLGWILLAKVSLSLIHWEELYFLQWAVVHHDIWYFCLTEGLQTGPSFLGNRCRNSHHYFHHNRFPWHHKDQCL